MNARQRRARREREANGLSATEGSNVVLATTKSAGASESDAPRTERSPAPSRGVVNHDDLARGEPRERSFLAPPPRPKREVVVLHGGANRGAQQNASVFADFNRRSAAVEIVPMYVDPVLGRAEAQRDAVKDLGIRAGAIEGRIEDIVVAIGAASCDPVILHIDRATDIAEVYRKLVDIARPLFGYLLVRLPTNRLLGVAYLSRAEDRAARVEDAIIFGTLGDISERNTSDMVVGGRADPAHVLIEPAIRRWFRRHTLENLNKVVAGTEPTANPYEVTTDGVTTRPLFMVVRQEWAEPQRLALEVAENPPMPMRRGVSFVVAEAVPGAGVRFHDARVTRDGRVFVGGIEVVDRASVERARQQALDDALREAAQRQAEEAQRRVERETLSRRNPIWTTD